MEEVFSSIQSATASRRPGGTSAVSATPGLPFFICVGVSKSLDGQYTCFGEVTRGMDVAYTISEVTTGPKDKPLDEVTIESIRLRPSASR